MFWENLTHVPIPLGGIAIRRSLPNEVKTKVNQMMRTSVEHAFAFPKQTYPYVRKHAQSMEEDVMLKHIQLYVNQYSVDLGVKGKNAINELYNKTFALNLIPKLNNNFFINS